MTKIMIVEDNLVAAMELEELLAARGYDVIAVVESGSEAIEKAKKVTPDHG